MERIARSKYFYALLFGLNFLATLPLWRLYFGMDDEALTVLGAQRILQGEWPYYHWDTHTTSGTAMLAAMYFGLFGSDQLATRSLMALIAASSGVVIYAIARRLMPAKLAIIPWTLWCCGGLTSFPLLSYHWMGSFWTLCSLHSILAWQAGQPRAAARLGISWALALWTLQSDALAVGLMVLFVAARLRPPGLLKVILFAVLASLVLWLPFLPVASTVWESNVARMFGHLSYGRYPYRWDDWLSLGRLLISGQDLPFLGRWAMGGYFYLQTLTYGLYYWIVVLNLLAAERSKQRPLIALAWCVAGWALASGNRQTVAYLSFSCPGVFLALTALLSHLPAAVWWARLVAALEIVGCIGHGLFLSEYWRYPIWTRAGVYYTDNLSQAQTWAVVRAWSDGYFPRASKVLAYPYFTSLYTLEYLRNPLRQGLLPLLYSEEWMLDAERTMASRPAAYIVCLDLDTKFLQTSLGIPVETSQKAAAENLQRITRGYRLVESHGSLRLYQRDEL